MSAEATRAHPIEVRYSNDDHTYWTLYSRHRSKKAADRAFAEACREMPEAWVQLRNDIMAPHLARVDPTLDEVLDDAGFDAGSGIA